MKSNDATITIADTKADFKAKAAGKSSVPTVTATPKATKSTKGGWKRRPVAIFDFILRLAAIGAALAATTVMGTTDQTLPFFTQFFQFQVSFDDLPALTFFVVANAIVSGYLFLSLPFSIVSIIRSRAVGAKLLLLILDTVMLALTSSAAAAAAAIVYLAHNGDSTANWLAMCQQFDEFCSEISGAVVASFIADVILFFLIVIAALSLRKHSK